MSETQPTPEVVEVPIATPAPGTTKRTLGFGLFTILLGIVALLAFGFGADDGLRSTLVLSPRDGDLIDLTLPSRTTGLVFASILLGLGLLQVLRRMPAEANAVLAFALLLFVVALLTWASRGDTTSVFGLLQGTLRRSIPIALGALAGVLCERAGVVNIAIEGMLLAGAFTGAIVGSAAGTVWMGLLAGTLVGGVLGLLLAVLSIRFKVDQIIGGTVINILALGLTSFLTARVLVSHPDLNRPGSFRPWEIPLLADIPIVGPLLFDNTVYVYLEFLLVGAVFFALFRTRWGLRVRAVGEHPRAADTVGIRVHATRYRAVLLGGLVAGAAGTYFTLDATGGFDENMTAGRGFIALAALIFGRWHPVGAFGAALVFGFAEELQGRLALLDTPIPSNFLLMLPYLVTLIVVAGVIGRARPPAADGTPYETH